ncbi:MAG: (Fe-S)-binding protein [Synergistaceae bacterium]|nr:(Fe-S)-binding protein [Synergistaceae bacterium]
MRLHQCLSFSGLFDKSAFFGGEWAFFPGCSMASHSPDLVMTVFRYLRSIYPDMGLLGNCCGQPALALSGGPFPKYREILERRFQGVARVVVCCPNCAVTLRRIPHLEVVSIWQVLREHLPEPGKIPGLPSFVLHDPCPTRNEPKVHEAVRYVLSHSGVVFEEYPSNREKTLCCGRANMLMVRNPEKGREMLMRRVSQSPCPHIVTYCFSCADAFKSAGYPALHGLDYLFAPAEKIDLNLRESLVRAWRNRWITARRIAALGGETLP